jgi:hypothetical protein
MAFMCLANFSLEHHSTSCRDNQKHLERGESPGNSTCPMLSEIPREKSKGFLGKKTHFVCLDGFKRAWIPFPHLVKNFFSLQFNIKIREIGKLIS